TREADEITQDEPDAPPADKAEAEDDAPPPKRKPPAFRAEPAKSLAGELVRVRAEMDRKGIHDQLDTADLAKDVVYTTGENPIPEAEQFQFAGGVLRTPEKGDSRLCLPAEVPKFYRLRIDAVLKPGAEDPEIGVGAVADGRQFFAEMWKKKFLLGQFYGRQLFSRYIGRSAKKDDPKLHDGVELLVSPWGIMLRRRSAYFEWSGSAPGWSLDDEWRVPASDKIFVCFPSGQYDVNSITLEPLAEEAWIEQVAHFAPDGVLAWAGKSRDQIKIAPSVAPLPKPGELREIILLQARRSDFDSLEGWAARFRKEDLMVGQDYALEVFYNVIAAAYGVGRNGSHGKLDAFFQGQIGFVDEWLKQKPASVAARVAKARAYLDYAWDARGGGMADTVPENAWAIFGQRMETAEQILEEAARLEPPDVCVYSMLVRIGRTRSYDKEKMFLTAGRGLKISKRDPDMIDALTFSFLPRWGGEPGDLGKAAQFSNKRIQGNPGLDAYLRVVRMSHIDEINLKRRRKADLSPEAYRNFSDPKVVLEEYSESKLRAAVPVVLKRHPNGSNTIKNHCCWIYCVLGDRAGAKALFAEIEKPALAIWETEDKYDHWRNWAGEADEK
ncbi:MAG TPA: hypothetical protein VMF30_05355, partial [Pirellulales bacterium]|nr:hypothetical protein [Pirellulales bacterium]